MKRGDDVEWIDGPLLMAVKNGGELVYASTLLKRGVPMRDTLYSTMTEPLTHDSDLKRSIEENLKNYFDLAV